jgi:predicted dehydrogenase
MAIRVGLIGGGNISNTHARAVHAIPGGEVVAIYGRDAQKVRALGGEYGAAPYADLQAFVAHRPMEMVIIGGPSGLHAEQGIAAARRGLHVLVEKPIDIKTERADALIEECGKAGVQLGVLFQDRCKPGIRQLKQLIDDGILGKILLVDARMKWYRPPEYYSGSRWRGTWVLDGGGALMNQGIHTVDLLLWLFGDVASVRARTVAVLHEIQVEDTALALLEFSSGAFGVLQATTAAYPGYARRLEVTGSEGTVILEGDQILAADLRTPQDVLVSEGVVERSSAASSPVVSDFRAHQRVIEDFIAAVRQDATPVCDGRQGRRSLELVERIYKDAGNSMPARGSKQTAQAR